MGADCAAILTDQLDACFVDEGWCAAFHDWDLVARHTSEMRRHWVRWAGTKAAYAARFTQFRLGPSRLLKFAVNAAHVAFAPQPFIVHKTREAYRVARAKHLSEPTPIPELVPLQSAIG